MSHVKSKTGRTNNFEALNTRRQVGQTYGERRQKGAEKPNLGWIESLKDRFFGNRESKNVGNFARKEDRFTHLISPNDVVRLNKTVEGGRALTGKTRPYSVNQHIRFLDSVIAFVDAKKGPRTGLTNG